MMFGDDVIQAPMERSKDHRLYLPLTAMVPFLF